MKTSRLHCNSSLFLLLSLFLLCSTNATSQSYEWTHHFGGSLMDYCDAIVTDSDGNVYATGFYRGEGFTIEDEVLPWVDNMDSFLAKFDSDGMLVWVIPFYGKGIFDRAEGVVMDNDGNVMVLSAIQENFMIGDQLTIDIPAENNNDMILMKFNPEGELLWNKTFGGLGSDLGYRLVKNEDHIFIVGHFVTTLTMGSTTLTSAGSFDMFICKLDLDGNVIWLSGYGGDSLDRLYNIDFYSNGDLAVCGYSTGDWTFGSTELRVGTGSFNGFWGRLDSEGEPMWAKQIVQTGAVNSSIFDLAIDDEDNVSVITTLYGTNTIESMEFDAEDGSQFALINYDKDGELDWLRIAVSEIPEPSSSGNAITFYDHNFWIAGGIGPELELFNKGFADVSAPSFYIAALNTDGDLIIDFYESSVNANSSALELVIDGTTVVVPLWVIGEATINGQTFITEDRDIVLAKIDFSGLVGIDEKDVSETTFVLSPNPVSDVLTVSGISNDIQSLQIFDKVGKLVWHQRDGLDTQTQISISHLPLGKYYVQLDYGKRVVIKGFVKM